MTAYRCLFLDIGGNIFGSDELQATNDAEAIAKARVIFATGLIDSHQMWDGDRLVHHERRGHGSSFR